MKKEQYSSLRHPKASRPKTAVYKGAQLKEISEWSTIMQLAGKRSTLVSNLKMVVRNQGVVVYSYLRHVG